MIKEYITMQDLRISNNNNNSHGRVSLTNAEGLRANTCNVVSPTSFLAVTKSGLAFSISKATPALFYAKNKNSIRKIS